MKWVIGLVALGLLTACGESKAPAPQPVAAAPLDPECRTVVVFDSTKISKPPSDLPDAWKAFSGVWGKAGWNNNTWCHDLYVMKIDEDGKVALMDTHGPGGGHDGTAFARVGKLGDDNRLRFYADGLEREYWIEDGKLMGVKHLSGNRTMTIAMLPKSAT